MVKFCNQLHIPENIRISRSIENRPIGNGKNKAGGYANVVSSLLVVRSSRVLCLYHGGSHVSQLHSSAKVHADGAGDSLGTDISREFIDCHYGGAMFLCGGYGIGDMVPVAVSQKDVINLFRQDKIPGILRISDDERVDKDGGSLRCTNDKCCVAQPRDACASQEAHGNALE